MSFRRPIMIPDDILRKIYQYNTQVLSYNKQSRKIFNENKVWVISIIESDYSGNIISFSLGHIATEQSYIAFYNFIRYFKGYFKEQSIIQPYIDKISILNNLDNLSIIPYNDALFSVNYLINLNKSLSCISIVINNKSTKIKKTFILRLIWKFSGPN